LRWSKDIGVTGFLMRFGEGLGAYSEPDLSEKETSLVERFG
jgi:hypothetical protein